MASGTRRDQSSDDGGSRREGSLLSVRHIALLALVLAIGVASFALARGGSHSKLARHRIADARFSADTNAAADQYGGGGGGHGRGHGHGHHGRGGGNGNGNGSANGNGNGHTGNGGNGGSGGSGGSGAGGSVAISA